LGEGQAVWVVEGEKSVDRMLELGAIAVSGDTGAKSKWLQEVWEAIGIPLERRQQVGRQVGQAMRNLGFTRRRVTAVNDEKRKKGRLLF
jgi:hypothetical protein